MPTDFPYPVKRTGNDIDPRLVILLENINSNPDFIFWNPEYVMSKDGVYFDQGMPIDTVRLYDKWWKELSESWNKDGKFKNSEVLALEYYPYATRKDTKDKEIYPGKKDEKWNEYAINALKENIEILKRLMRDGVYIFVYYKSGWFDKVPELACYEKLKISSIDNSEKHLKSTLPNIIRKRFEQFIDAIEK